MVSSFRALSFASRALSGKKDENEREREGKETAILFLSIGTAEATRSLSPKGAFFRRLEKEERKKRRTRDGWRTTNRGWQKEEKKKG